jgi:hypothetical protein
MFSALNYGASARFRLESSTNDLQKLFEVPATTLEEVLAFPNVISELQAPIQTHGFFTNEVIEQLISLVFEPASLRKYTFDEGRKYAYIASEILSAKIAAVTEYFFHKETMGAAKKTGKVDELDVENDFQVGQDLLLSPVNSVKSRSNNVIEVCNKPAMSFLVSKALSRPNIDETRAGYLAKILNAFFQRSKNEFLAFFYKSGIDYQRFLHFLDFYSVTDFLNNVVLYESSMSNDSMIFQDTQPQISPDYAPLRIEFFGKIIAHPAFKGSFEVACNIKQLLEAFFSKYKNIGEADEFMQEIFVRQGYFKLMQTRLEEAQELPIVFELLSIVKIVTSFFLICTNSKVEVISEATRALFQAGTPVHGQLLELIGTLKGRLATTGPQSVWTNTFMHPSSRSGLKSLVCVLEIFTNLMKQKIVDVNAVFLHKEFVQVLLVNLLESIRCFPDLQFVPQRLRECPPRLLRSPQRGEDSVDPARGRLVRQLVRRPAPAGPL